MRKVNSALDMPCVTEDKIGLINGISDNELSVDCGNTSEISRFSKPSATSAVVMTLTESLASC